MRSFGAPEAEIERWRAMNPSAAGIIEVPLYCRRAVEIFLAVDTQWRKLRAGDRLILLGLDYAGVRAGLGMMHIRPTPEIFADLKLMEDAALEAMSEAR